MTRPTRVYINPTALLHNVSCVRRLAPNKKIIAMVKANAYGSGLYSVLPVLEGQVEAFGVACIEEALRIRNLGSRTDCVLFQGIFSPEELRIAAYQRMQIVIHQVEQLRWLLATPLSTKIKVWVKVDTGMHRLGFSTSEIPEILNALLNCTWVQEEIGLMTHLARADEPEQQSNTMQLAAFADLSLPKGNFIRSIANSAAIFALPDAHADVVRPGIMLYGISPFVERTGNELGLMAVVRLVSAISAIHHYPPNSPIGYGGIWSSEQPTIIGVVAVGYGDGYPRHIAENTPTWVNGFISPIVGRVSMDTLTIDLTNCPGVKVGDAVELWGTHIPIETVAKSAGTIAYELLCQMSLRVTVTS